MNKKVRNVLLTAGISLVVLGVGGKMAFDYAADKAIKKLADEATKDPQVQKLLKDKDVQQKLDQLRANPDLQKNIDGMAKEASVKALPANAETGAQAAKSTPDKGHGGTAGTTGTTVTGDKGTENTNTVTKGSENVHFSNTSEAATYAMKRFSVSEINHYRQMVGDGLTPDEKKELKRVALSRFSSEEIRALIEVAKK